MAITVTGVEGSMEVPEWSQIGDDMAPAVVKDGLQVSVVTGTRLVSVAVGRSYQAGSNAFVTAAQQLTLAANTSGKPRIDLVCLQVDFSGTETTAGTLVVLQGVPLTNPIPPTPTQDAGGIWQTPLPNGQVRVVNNADQLLSSNLTDPPATAGGARRSPGSETHSINGSGLATITHNLGVIPKWIDVTVINSNWLATPLWSSRTATTFQAVVRRIDSGALVTSTSDSFIWKAEA